MLLNKKRIEIKKITSIFSKHIIFKILMMIKNIIFKVMICPLKAVNLVHIIMSAMLEKIK